MGKGMMLEGVAAAVELGAWVGWMMGVVLVVGLVPLTVVVWVGLVDIGHWVLGDW